jgi:hypothetical protein
MIAMIFKLKTNRNGPIWLKQAYFHCQKIDHFQSVEIVLEREDILWSRPYGGYTAFTALACCSRVDFL